MEQDAHVSRFDRESGSIGMLRRGGGSHPFVRRVAMAGVSAAMLATTVGSGAVVHAQSAGTFDPMACAGKAVRVALVDGERDDLGLRDKEAEIEAATGIDIQLTTMALGALNESIAQNLRAPESAFDIVHILGFTVAATAGAGLLEELTPYVSDPTKTPADYDFADFPAGQLRVHRLLRPGHGRVRWRPAVHDPGHPFGLRAAVLPHGPPRWRRPAGRAHHLGGVPRRRPRR